MEILVLKTGALGDVLRTTSILPGLARRHSPLRVTWLTAHGAVDLVSEHPLVGRVVAVDPKSEESLEAARELLAGERFDRVLSFDDEEPLCRLAAALAGSEQGVLFGAYLDQRDQRGYTDEAAPWFDMGLLSRFGKAEADRLKRVNRESHPAIYAGMLGIEMGEPELPLPEEALEFGRRFAERTELASHGPVIGLNTGAGGRWESKRLPVERVAALMAELGRRHANELTFLLLGGPEEAERNRRIVEALPAGGRLVDGGTENTLLEAAALVAQMDVIISSDSLALHLAISQRTPVVVFFAPTSAAEIELYGRGEKVVSTADDFCSYRPDADTSTLTVERLADAVDRVLAALVARRD